MAVACPFEMNQILALGGWLVRPSAKLHLAQVKMAASCDLWPHRDELVRRCSTSSPSFHSYDNSNNGGERTFGSAP